MLLMTGMLFSNFLMSVSQILLCGNWLAEGELKKKFLSFLHNRTALVITSLFVLHILGLIYSTDLTYGMHDVKIKLPLLILPLIISTSSLIPGKTFLRLLMYFVAVVFIASIVSFCFKLAGKMTDVRETSIFISHIRFSLNICIAFFISVYFILYSRKNMYLRLVYAAMCLWFIVFLIILEAATGLAIIIIVSVILLSYLIITIKDFRIIIPAASFLVFLPCITIWYCIHTLKEYSHVERADLRKLDKYTGSGNLYIHDTSYFIIENGRYPGLYVSGEELVNEWNKRSGVKITMVDGKYPMIFYTLIRFMSSKGYRKDAEGIKKLTEKDIKSIEKGIANAEYLNVFSLKSRLFKIAYEYNSYCRSGNAENKSLMQRLELWKTACSIIGKNFYLGVGTGDVKQAFHNELIFRNSTLKDKGLRAHNQYLTVLIAFGITGLLWFLITLFYPLFADRKHFNYFFVIFLLVVVISMFTEDTLETQAGATLFAFFTSFFLFRDDQRLTIAK